jgi:hypothetical protein
MIWSSDYALSESSSDITLEFFFPDDAREANKKKMVPDTITVTELCYFSVFFLKTSFCFVLFS